MTELKRVLREKFKLKDPRLNDLIHLVTRNSQLVYPQERLQVVRKDPADNRVLECAAEARADYLITGDKRHLLPLKKFQGTKIVMPRDFADQLIIL